MLDREALRRSYRYTIRLSGSRYCVTSRQRDVTPAKLIRWIYRPPLLDIGRLFLQIDIERGISWMRRQWRQSVMKTSYFFRAVKNASSIYIAFHVINPQTLKLKYGNASRNRLTGPSNKLDVTLLSDKHRWSFIKRLIKRCLHYRSKQFLNSIIYLWVITRERCFATMLLNVT